MYFQDCLQFRSPAPPEGWWSKTFLGDRKLKLKMPMEAEDKYGKKYEFDQARLEDIDKVYALFMEASSSGIGYTHQEIPSKSSMEEVVTEPSSTHIFVMRDEGEIVLAWYIDPSIYTRSARPVCCDSWTVVAKAYRNKGLTTKNFLQFTSVLLDLGYEGMLFDAFMINTSSLMVAKKNGGIIVGMIPYSGYLVNHGWADSLMFYGDNISALSRLLSQKSKL
jgi:L-amino acid N-acyltransferase YncA